jgi:hypothetical protein
MRIVDCADILNNYEFGKVRMRGSIIYRFPYDGKNYEISCGGIRVNLYQLIPKGFPKLIDHIVDNYIMLYNDDKCIEMMLKLKNRFLNKMKKERINSL